MDKRRLTADGRVKRWGDRWREDEEDEGKDGRTKENRWWREG